VSIKIIRVLLTCALIALAACGQGDVADLMKEGQQHLEDKNYQGAIVIFKTVLEESPEKMEARFGLGKAYLMMGKLEQAEKSFEKYQRQNPYDNAIKLEIGRLKIVQQKFDEAMDTLASYLEADPGSAEGYELLGKAHWGKGDLQEGRAYLEKAVSMDDGLVSARLALAQLDLVLGDVEAAEKNVAYILERDPKHHEGLYFRARLEGRRSDFDAYRATFKEITEAYPNDAYAKYIFAKGLLEAKEYDRATQIALELGAGAPNRPYGKKIIGMIHYAKQEYKEAADAFLEGIAILPEPEGYFFLGMSYYGMGELETAMTNLRIAAERSGKFLKAREMISLILLQQNRIKESIAEAERILDIDENNVVARIIMGDAYMAQGQSGKALAQLRQITEKEPLFAEAFMKMGALHYALGEMKESESAFRSAMNAAPDSVRPRLVLSNVYLRNGDKDLARAVLEDGLKGTREDVILYAYLARLALTDKDVGRAKKLLAEAKSLDAANPAPYIMLASIHLSEKKPEEAVAEYDSLLEHRKGYLQALLNKAAILEALNRQEDAEQVYVESVKSGDPRAYLAYAGSKRKKQDAEGALTLVNEGLTKSPNNRELIKMKAETLFSMKRYDDVLTMSDELEKVQREAGLGLRVRAYLLKGDLGKAIVAAKQMVDHSPKYPEGYLVLADIYVKANRLDDAFKTLEDGVKKCGRIPVLLLELGKYYSMAGDLNKALAYTDTILKRDPKFYQAYALRGDIYIRQGKEKRAIKSYKMALERTERYVPVLNNLAMIYLKDPKTAPEALRLAYTAYLQMPWNPSVMDTFGYALAVNGRNEDAIKILEKAALVAKDNPAINYHLGYAYHKSGQNELAAARLESVVNCENCENAEDARRLLNKINGS